MTASILDVAGLTVSFRVGGRWRPIVKNIAFNIAPRETLAIVGESGSGKSVTALSIMRLLQSDTALTEGRIWLDGRDLLLLSEGDMLKIRGNDVAMIFQEPMTSLNPVLTVGFQLTEALLLHRSMSRKEAEAEAVQLMNRVRIPNAALRLADYPHRFSGGMRQRVMIAMALACRPRLLIADEPTTALDVTIQAEILELIKSLQEEEGLAVLFITHDMGVVSQIADRTLVMYQGEIVEQGKTEAMFTGGAHPYTRALLAAVPKLGSTGSHARPIRFPVVDIATGLSDVPVESPNTVRELEQPVLKVENLTTRFPIRAGVFGRVSSNVHAVENVSFEVKAGETLALVGESGCGKSTTGRSILRLTEPLSGSVNINGRDVVRLNNDDLRNARRDMQMIFQDPFASLNPRLTLGAAVMEPLLAHGLQQGAREKVADLLVRVGLTPDMAKRYPHELSGGQRQRICIARALALEPKLVIADEPVAALDVSIKAKVVNLMLDLQASMNLAYLFISHDMAVVERMSHRVAVMYLGEIVEIGPRVAIFQNPQHPYTCKLLDAVPETDPTRRRRVRPSRAFGELKSPIRARGFLPPVRQYREISAGHLVQEWTGESDATSSG